MKGKFKKPIAFLMALALVFNMGFTAYAGAIPSNYNGNRFVAKAEDIGGGSEELTVTDEVYGAPLMQSFAPLATVYSLPVYTSDADLLDASGQSPNKKTTIEKIWLHNGVLYIGVIGSLKSIDTVYYDGVSVHFSSDISTDGAEPLRIGTETFPIPSGRDKEAHWVVIKVNLSDITFDGPFSLGIDTSAGGFDPDNVDVTLQGYVIRYLADKGGHIDGLATQTVYVGGSTQPVTAMSDTGYSFVDWSDDITDPTRHETNVRADATYTAYFNSTSATYTVEHYKENLTGGYTIADTDSKSGTTGELTAAEAKSYDGFEAKLFSQETISANGSTVVKIYYDRKTYKLTYEITGSYFAELEHATQFYRYGETVIAAAKPSQTGYTFNGWNNVPATMPASDAKATGYYTANDYFVYYTGGDSDDTRILMDKKNPYYYENEVIVLDNLDDVFVTASDRTKAATRFVKTGYHVIGWNQAYQYSPQAVSKPVVNIARVQYYPGNKIVMPDYNITLDAVWAQNTDTQYTIETYLQEDGVYPAIASSSVVMNDGITNETKTITPSERAGYKFDDSVSNILEALIAADGSTVFKLYYKKAYTINYQAGQNGILEGGNKTYTLYYGDLYPKAPVPVPNTNYVFSTWTPVLPEAEATVTGDKTFTAYFTPEATASYTVYYYRNGTTTAVHEPKTVTGQKIGSSVSESAVSVSGYSVVAPTSKTITLGESINTIIFYYLKDSNPDPKPRPRPDRDTNPVVVVEEPIPLALNMVDHFQYLQGYPDNTVRPEGNITREEVAAVFYRLLMDDYRGSIMTNDENFPDVEANTWSTKYIATLTNGKILEGYEDGTFKPHNFITKAELAAVASRFDNLSPFEDDSFTDIAGHWANKYINSAAKKGWVKGNPDGTFKPDKYITRAEFATLVNNVLDRRVQKDKILETARKFPDLPATKWYYEAMMEAVNSHLFNRLEDGYEEWTEISHPDIEL